MPIGPANSRSVKKFNRLTVLNMIKEDGPLSRLQLARITGLTPAAMTGIVRELVELGFVRETGLGNSTRGRKPVKLAFNPEAAYTIGIEITHYETTMGIANLMNAPTDIRTLSLDMTEPRTGIPLLADAVKKMIGQDRNADKNILGIGVAFPGLLDLKAAAVKRSINLGPGWNDFPLQKALAEELSLPVVVETNSRVSALAEKWFGRGVGRSDLVYINLGEGISAGVILEDRLLQGAQGHVALLGHILIDKNGPLCNCGNKGCLEAFCGVPALVKKALAAWPVLAEEDPLRKVLAEKGQVGVQDLLTCAADRGSFAWEMLREVSGFVGVAAASIVNLYNPGVIVLGGKIARGVEPFLSDVRRTATAHAFPEVAEATDIVVSEFDANAAVMGACALAVRELLESPQSQLLEEQPERHSHYRQKEQ